MKIEFDPHNPDDLAVLARLLGTSSVLDVPDQVYIPTETVEPTAPVETVEPTAPVETVEPTAPVETVVDVHGMPWRDDIHSNPPSKNADGSWRAKRGKKDEYDAAYAVLTAPAAAPEPTGPAMPAAPEPTAPAAPVTYHQMAERFVASLETFGVDFQTIYVDLGVDFHDLETNVTSINRLWTYMDNRAAGQDHPTAATGALQ